MPNAGSTIDFDSWTATLLPHPKRHVRSKAIGFCQAFPVGSAESAAGRSAGCWWPDGVATLLMLDGHKDLSAIVARGNAIGGAWNKRTSGRSGACAWQFEAGALTARDLHRSSFEQTWAEGVGAGLVLGVGTFSGKLGRRPPKCGLVWDAAGDVTEVRAAGDVSLRATDGTRLAGSVDGRAALWPVFDAPAVDLASDRMPASEVHALDGALQVGYAFDERAARAMLWHGTAASARDLTPAGHAEARAFDGTNGYQVGFVRARLTTPSGLSAFDNRAVIWQGTPDSCFDLNAVLPAPFNASVAWALCFTDDTVKVCGEALRVDVSDAGTAREYHGVALAQAVVWTARLTGRRSPS